MELIFQQYHVHDILVDLLELATTSSRAHYSTSSSLRDLFVCAKAQRM